jgi:L-iditol 2-dehydrogenase
MWVQELTRPGLFTEVDLPAPTEADLVEGELLLRVLAGGVCGSDLSHFLGKPGPFTLEPGADGSVRHSPGTPMHEVVGEVVASRDDTHHVGTRVVGWASRWNAMSESIIVKGGDVHPIAPDLAPHAAILLQPLACVLFAVDSFRDVEGSEAAVIGLGPIGVLFAHVLKARGAAKVTGVDRVDRSDVAGIFGIDDLVTTTSHFWANVTEASTRKPAIVVEAVGHQVSTLNDTVRAVANGGQIYYFGIPDDPIYPFSFSLFQRKNLTLISGVTPYEARRESLARAEKYLAEYPELSEPYTATRFTFGEASAAFTAAIRPVPGQLKVTLEL